MPVKSGYYGAKHKRPGILTALVLLVLSYSAAGAPSADLWSYWQVHDETSTRAVDHAAWGAFLDEYLVEGDDGINRMRYAAVTDADLEALDDYIRRLSSIEVTSLDRDAQFAFWVNLYNALTVDVILDHYPVDSIRDIDISPGWFSDGPWGKKLVTIEDRELSLDDIEHRILRPVWQDPRVHYAVNCAALGCPNLKAEPYTADRLEEQLNRQARTYINHSRGARFENGDLVVSSIYDWFREDFGGSEEGVLSHLMECAAPALREDLEEAGDIDGYEYDWALNDARTG
jgi:hypothetical protein